MANIQKANQDAVYKAIAADTGVDIARIKSFMESKGIEDPSILAGNESLLLELMESGKGAIEPAAPNKPAPKRGRKPKSKDVPQQGMQTYQSRVGAEIAGMQQAIEGHLSQWEAHQAQQLLERFEATPGNILQQVNAGLEEYSDDADFFRDSLGSTLSELLPLS